jgi:hypothetical protein
LKQSKHYCIAPVVTGTEKPTRQGGGAKLRPYVVGGIKPQGKVAKEASLLVNKPLQQQKGRVSLQLKLSFPLQLKP